MGAVKHPTCMKPAILLAMTTAGLLLCGCEKSDEMRAKEKAKQGAQELKQDLKKAGDEIDRGLDKAGKEIKKAGQELKHEVNDAKER